jgi:hypothetical protein
MRRPASVWPAAGTAGGASALFAVSIAAYLWLDAGAFLAVVATKLGWLGSVTWLSWVQIHLLTIGVIVQTAFAGVLHLSRRRSRAGEAGPLGFMVWGLVNVGLLLLLVAMTTGDSGRASLGALAVLAALLLVLTSIPRSSPQDSTAALARRFYATGLGFLVVGIGLALQLLRGLPAPGGFPGVLEAHIHANVWGFVGLMAGGACLNLIPRLTGAPVAHPSLARRCFWLLTIGSTGLVVGAWFGVLPLTMMGMLLYVLGTLAVLVNLVAAGRGVRWRQPIVGHVVAAYAWIVVPALVAPVTVIRTGQLPAGSVETAALGAILAGWVLQLGLVVFSAVAARGAIDVAPGSWVTVALFNAGVVAVWLSAAGKAGNAPVVAGYVLILAAWLPRLGQRLATWRLSSTQLR